MGSLFGGRLAMAGNDVTMIAVSPAAIETINRDSIIAGVTNYASDSYGSGKISSAGIRSCNSLGNLKSAVCIRKHGF